MLNTTKLDLGGNGPGSPTEITFLRFIFELKGNLIQIKLIITIIFKFALNLVSDVK